MKKGLLVFFLVMLQIYSMGHPMPKLVTETYPLSAFQIFLEYIRLGFSHVIPSGFDHVLFILGIFFLNSNIRSVLLQCTLFTLAHSVSLGIAATGFFLPDSKIIEPLIAFTIMFVAVENVFMNKINSRRMVLIFCFGIIHGLGFASALSENGLSQSHFMLSLLSFNVGVELGQILIIVLAYYIIADNFKEFKWYKNYITNPISIIIGLFGLYWFVERLMS